MTQKEETDTQVQIQEQEEEIKKNKEDKYVKQEPVVRLDRLSQKKMDLIKQYNGKNIRDLQAYERALLLYSITSFGDISQYEKKIKEIVKDFTLYPTDYSYIDTILLGTSVVKKLIEQPIELRGLLKAKTESCIKQCQIQEYFYDNEDKDKVRFLSSNLIHITYTTMQAVFKYHSPEYKRQIISNPQSYLDELKFLESYDGKDGLINCQIIASLTSLCILAHSGKLQQRIFISINDLFSKYEGASFDLTSQILNIQSQITGGRAVNYLELKNLKNLVSETDFSSSPHQVFLLKLIYLLAGQKRYQHRTAETKFMHQVIDSYVNKKVIKLNAQVLEDFGLEYRDSILAQLIEIQRVILFTFSKNDYNFQTACKIYTNLEDYTKGFENMHPTDLGQLLLNLIEIKKQSVLNIKVKLNLNQEISYITELCGQCADRIHYPILDQIVQELRQMGIESEQLIKVHDVRLKTNQLPLEYI
ncbi:UNKNOWN [Stylonychia lemnae]|uniref:Uncharacterized protein n=1 Tax=Stylonychia lemnae TaxID=5949 RepID=A0A078B6S4_STYLE|nr:UNKNOWN [Stylonychia lemnae]|eukprot:CDW89886.1 UNKNOWN [Stylonychia lemnae]